MTKEEAIKYFEHHMEFYCVTGVCKEAEEMAIKALGQESYYKDLAESYERTINKLTKAIAEQEPNCPFYKIDEDGHGLCKNHRLEQEPSGDLISRQAVIDILEKEGHKWGNDYRDWVDAIEEIKKLPSVRPQEPKWIPISERLPEKNVWVLVTVVQGSGWYVEIMRIDKYKGMFTDNIDYYDSVIAWIPLPKPYEPQESEVQE